MTLWDAHRGAVLKDLLFPESLQEINISSLKFFALGDAFRAGGWRLAVSCQ